MNDRRHPAAVLFILAWVVTLHQWVPMLLVVVFVSWVVAHTWLEGPRGQLFIGRWQRAWPPPTLVLIPLFAVGTLVLGASDLPIVAKVLPVALSTLALAMLLVGNGKRGTASRRAENRIRVPVFGPRPRTVR